jgi:hypothetical protein
VSQKLALLELKRSFPHCRDAHIAVAWEAAGHSLVEARALLSSGVAFSSVDLAAAATWVPRLDAAAAPPAARGHGSGGSVTGGSCGGAGRKVATIGKAGLSIARGIGDALAWVETGEAVAVVYSQARAQAEAYAKARNLAFDRSTAAYRGGDRAAAAHHARQGREMDALMRRAHAAAAAEIFAARNGRQGGAAGLLTAGKGRVGGLEGGSMGSSGGGVVGAASSSTPAGRDLALIQLPRPATLSLSGSAAAATRTGESCSYFTFDLHGLHPHEAADVILAAVDAAAESQCGVSYGGSGAGGSEVWCAFVTGSRHHSKRLGKGGGSLAAAVAATLEEAGLEFYRVGVGGGIIAVRVAPSL